MTPTDTRLRLRAGGYCPIPVQGKIPASSAWQKKNDANSDEIELWALTYPYASNTGILTALTPCLDIDINYPDAAEAVEDLVSDRYESDRGYVLVRFGRPPRRAILAV